MDDFIKSENSLQTLTRTTISVTTTFSQFGFRLHKWVANNNILHRIPKSEKSKLVKKTKILGVNWDTSDENLILQEVSKTYLPTKRDLLSLLCSVFDPSGFITPCLLEPKLIVQSAGSENQIETIHYLQTHDQDFWSEQWFTTI